MTIVRRAADGTAIKFADTDSIPDIDAYVRAYNTKLGSSSAAGPPPRIASAAPQISAGRENLATFAPFATAGLAALLGPATGGMSLLPALLTQGAIAGAGAIPGALAGRAIRGQGPPRSPLDIAPEVGEQSIYGTGSELLARPLAAAARPLMRMAQRAVPPTEPTAAAAEAFRQIAPTAIREQIPVGGLRKGPGVLERGSSRAERLVQQSAQELEDVLAEAGAQGITLRAKDLTGPAVKYFRQLTRGLPSGAENRAAVLELARKFNRENPGPLTPVEVNVLKKKLYTAAKRAFKAAGKEGAENPAILGEPEFNKAVAREARKAIERATGGITSSAGRSAREINQRTGELMSVRRVTRRAELPRPESLRLWGFPGLAGSSAGFATHNPLVGALALLAARLAETGPVASRAALFAAHPATGATVRQLPRLAGAGFSTLQDR